MSSGKVLEVIFVSYDRTQQKFDEYFQAMPWLAVAFDRDDLKETLDEDFGVTGIPTLVVLDAKVCLPQNLGGQYF